MDDPHSKNIVRRHSTREFKSDSIPIEALKSILKAGILAPSSKNRQPWQIYVISKERLYRSAEKMKEHIMNIMAQCVDEELLEDLLSAL